MRLYSILVKPIITEKTANMQVDTRTYGFEVAPHATKIDIKKAVLDLYGMEVSDVRVLNTREKFKHGRKRGMQLRKRTTRKAYVTLKNKSDTLDFSLTK